MENDIFLGDCWSLYFHDPANESWDAKSFQLLQTISTVQDWVYADKAFQNLWQDGMFFLMREHIQPVWEDPHNSKGGCLSFKVNKPESKEYWFQLGCKTVGEVLSKNTAAAANVCGVSISPKRSFCILRVWLASEDAPENFFLETPYYTQIMYKSHAQQSDYEVSL